MILGQLPTPRQAPLLWASGALSVALLLWMNLGFALPFRELAGNRPMPDLDIGSTAQRLLELRTVLQDRQEAVGLLRGMHLGPDLLLPASLGLFIALLLQRLARGASLYGRPAERLLPFLLAVPVAYAGIDYAENILCILLFQPSVPAPGAAVWMAEAISWLTRLKFVFLVVSGIVVLRLAFGPKPIGDC